MSSPGNNSGRAFAPGCGRRFGAGMRRKKRFILTARSVRLHFSATTLSGMVPSKRTSEASQRPRNAGLFHRGIPRFSRRDRTPDTPRPNCLATAISSMVPSNWSSLAVQYFQPGSNGRMDNWNRRSLTALILHPIRLAAALSEICPSNRSAFGVYLWRWHLIPSLQRRT